MNEEEYLRACGWMPRQEGGWDPPLRSTGGPTHDVYSSPWTTAEALKRQVTEDRARLAFVLARSAVSMSWPAPQIGPDMSQCHDAVSVTLEPKR